MNKTPIVGLGAALVVAGGAFFVTQRSGTEPASFPTPADQPGAVQASTADGPVVQVWKSPSCGCCSKWVEHLQAAGFVVQTTEVQDMAAVKARYGIPGSLQSCHTALVDGYLLEGHVPAEDIQRLLDDRPEVAGLSVPGMPVGSPGMEVGDQKQPFDVLTFTGDGQTAVYAKH